jgi:hypothetical protein
MQGLIFINILVLNGNKDWTDEVILSVVIIYFFILGALIE